MKIRFADARPQGDYALVVPVAGKDRSTLAALGTAGEAVAAALDRQRFEGEGSSVSEQFIADDGKVRRLLVIGTGNGAAGREAAEKLGGTAAARLQTSVTESAFPARIISTPKVFPVNRWDPLAAALLVMAAGLAREGLKAWRRRAANIWPI